ncbi:MAG: Aldose sugar dehydrogenase YliI [Paracidovorax wautersii]|uniref:Aldose sugar dehydrogenase YliI n=1 Tax=Paracidovorax wautersii TaxID=1177982 RepID=A0A7V8FLW6_9BURK|nr:MAG: Aldose sugar dehydrogenase YliI [Paracidovorax wautersii]
MPVTFGFFRSSACVLSCSKVARAPVWAFACVALGLSAGAHAQEAQASDPIAYDAVAQGLEAPWAVAFIDDGRFLVSERRGRLRVVEADGQVGPPVQGVPSVVYGGQGGLLDVVADSGYARNRTLYFCFAEAGPGGGVREVNSTALASARLSSDRQRLEDVKVLFSQQPKVASQMHYGCRVTEMPDGTLMLALGERSSQSQQAQNLQSHLGKVVRLNKDGSVPADNPFVGRSDARPEIWSYGHRNPQGAALSPDGVYWLTEHGPRGGDEINLPQAGLNYGWPEISHGRHYSGLPVGTGDSARPGMEAPLLHWTPSIAPSGTAFVNSDRYGPGWRGNLLVGSLKFNYLERLQIQGQGREVAIGRRSKLLADLGERIRDVRQGPDGWIYVLTDGAQGQLLRLKPAS